MFNSNKLKSGSIIIHFDSRGCMGEQHHFYWIGIVTGFHTTKSDCTWKDNIKLVEVKIIKHRDQNGDIRDRNLGYDNVAVTNVQHLYSNLFATWS